MKNSDSSGCYQFEYDSTNLPPYNSKETDLWGYYNGINYNRHFWQDLEAIRTPNPTLMKAEILTKITYPTGGYTRLYYSPHQYSKVVQQFPFEVLTTASSIAGGLRIIRIEDYTGDGHMESRLFSYGASGILNGRHHNFAQGIYEYNELFYMPFQPGMGQASYTVFSESTLNELSTTEGSHVTYSEVVESKTGKGSTHYIYSNYDTPGCMDCAPFYRANNYDGRVITESFNSKELSRGNLLSVKRYDDSGGLVEEENNVFSQDTLSCISSILFHSHCGNYIFGINGHKIYTYFPSLVQKQVKTYYDNGLAFIETIGYEYDSYRNVKKVTRTAGGHTEIQATSYPADISNGVYPLMAARHLLNYPVETVTARDGKVVEASLTTYRYASGQYLPSCLYRAAPGTNTLFNSFTPYNGQSINSIYYRDKYISSYDVNGNILELYNRENVPTSFRWDSRGNNLNGIFTGSANGNRTIYVQGPIPHTETNTYVSADEAVISFTAEIDGPFSLTFAALDTLDVISAKLDNTYLTLSGLGQGIQGTSTPVSIMAGQHVLTVQCTMHRVRAFGGGGDLPPIETYPLTGELSITYPYYGAVTQTRYGQDCFFEDFESESGISDNGFESDKGYTGTFSRNIFLITGRTYILDYMQRDNGNWHYVRETVIPDVSPFTVTVAATSSKPVDHVRFYPADNAVSSYTWWPTGELRCAVDGSGRIITYEYDSCGRLTAIKDGDGNELRGYNYHYAVNNQDHNFISENVYTDVNGNSNNQTITYYDGLGRPVETVKKGAWLSGNSVSGDVISTISYDACGRPCLELLPTGIIGNDGDYVAPVTALATATVQYGDAYPYTEVQYDSIPFDRVRTEWGAGQAWRNVGKSVSRAYHSNTYNNTSLHIKGFSVSYSGDLEVVVIKGAGVYVDGLFRVEEIVDEDGRKTSVFFDALGLKCLERRFLSENSYAETYYCYDNAGHLLAVLPPELTAYLLSASGTTFTLSSTSSLRNYGYFYRYDNKGQLIAKILPGAQWIYYIYDKGGRLVYTQDGNQRLKGEWSFVLNDIQGRECIKGTVNKMMSPFNDPLGDVQVFAQRNEPSTDMQDYGYLAVNFDMHGADVLSVTWYDDYSFLGNMDGIPSAASTTSPTRYSAPAPFEGLGEKYEYSGAAQVTGKYEKVLGETDGNVYLWTVLYYDDRGRVVQESHSTHRGGWQRTNTGYDFTGHPLKTRTVSHDEIAGDMTEHYTYSYDAWGRPLAVSHALDNLNPVQIHSYVYDGAGRMISDARNGNAKLATTCAYNVRSWLTDIWVGGNANQGTLGESFTEKLYYQNQRSQHPQDSLQWAGNISAMDWMAVSDGVVRRYDFAYDGLSRLTGASYGDSSNGTGLYNRAYTYDRNSNITSVTTPTATTQLYYMGNQLAGGPGPSYDYDANGNLTEDYDRQITGIEYNILNLPSSVTVSTSGSGPGSLGVTSIETYLYSASGVKLQAKEESQILPLPGQQDNSARTDYVGNLIYDRTSLKKVLFPGGYAEASGNSWLYRFFVTDHLGNNRLVLDATGAMSDVNHYGPYGESLTAGAATGSGNPYKWGGKEYVGELDSYDFGARYYTTSIPRWTTMDPLCEKYYSISPYAYCAGNPVNMVDPDGMIFTDNSLPYVNKYEESIQKKREEATKQFYTLNNQLWSALCNGGDFMQLLMQVNSTISILQDINVIQMEFDALKSSDQVYEIRQESIDLSDGNTYYGLTSFDKQSGNVVVSLRDGHDMAALSHELKHCYQFENGDLDLITDPTNNERKRHLLYDYYDEVEAHKRGAFFGGGIMDENLYKNLRKEHSSINRLWTPEGCIACSQKFNIVFRFNGVTYVP